LDTGLAYVIHIVQSIPLSTRPLDYITRRDVIEAVIRIPSYKIRNSRSILIKATESRFMNFVQTAQQVNYAFGNILWCRYIVAYSNNFIYLL